MENFPRTRLESMTPPAEKQPMVDLNAMRQLPPASVRELLQDGNFAGLHVRSDDERHGLRAEALAETRDLLERG